MQSMKENLANGRDEDTASDRIEPIPKSDFPHHKYPRWIGHKFSPSGDVLQYPGNIILAHLPPDTIFHQRLQSLAASLKAHPLAAAFTFLPESSWHMTLYEGVTDQIRLRNSYPGELPLDSSLKVCHAHVATQLADFEHNLGPEGVGEMKVVGFEPVEDGLGLTLQPTSPAKEASMRDLRSRLSAQLKMRHPGHEEFSWHMALGYTCRFLTMDEKTEIETFLQDRLASEGPLIFELGIPEFCVYGDMCQFRRVFHLE